MIAITSSCGIPHRKKPVVIHRPVATDPQVAQQPEEKASTGIEEENSGDNDSPQHYDTDPETVNNPTDGQNSGGDQTVQSFSSEHLTVSSGTADSVSVYEFTGADARILYKTMSIARETVTGSTAKYHYVKKGENIACERFVFAEDLNTANYRCKIRLKSQSGATEEATTSLTAGTPDEILNAKYMGSTVTVSPSNEGLTGVIHIAGADAKVLSDNLTVDAIAGKKIGTHLSCTEAQGAATCALAFSFDTGKSLAAN
jgi:hypothetical protein